MRFSSSFFCNIFLFATNVVSEVFPWVEDDLIGGQTINVKYIDEGSTPLLVDLSVFEVVIFSGGNESPVTLYTSRRFNFSEIRQLDDPSGNEMGFKDWYTIPISVPWSIGPNIARGYFLGFRSHFKQNESIEYITYTARVSMLNNGSLSSEIEEAAKADGQAGAGPPSSWVCKGQPCSRSTALSWVYLTQPKPKKFVEPLNENQKFAIGLSTTIGGLFLILLAGIIWRCRQIRSEKKDSKRRWWNKIPSPEAGASELQGRNGPYTTAELGGEGNRGSVFELQAGSIREGSDGTGDKKCVSSMEAFDFEETQRLHPSGDNVNKVVGKELAETPRMEMDGNEARDIDEILPVDPKRSKFGSKYTKNRDRKHSSAPIPDATTRPLRDTSPHESTAMLT
ncbi:hypothetical protein ONS95_003589 [Cadophora gregata]|uniref:uncharacterized protein n=1 Tax=Cadophora gregata TaxID=51156 RepID=UPI0026DBFDD2|nr:uncharacterized protein ONS95_003589 [Cadophora gregata]KAK0106867.1 hypothetical protein ONS95_003589 [Cadophora gregata]KAK0116554.1 hypothetical protein ONS96_012412 [Cadophora gregata f. sp. sojae]